MQRPLYGLATALTPFTVAGPPLDDAPVAVVPTPPNQHVVAATTRFAAAAPWTLRTDTGSRVVLVQQRDEAVVLKVALIGGLAMTLAWMVAAHRPVGSSAARSLPAVPDATTSGATSAPEVNRLAKPVHRHIERPASRTNVAAAASAPAQASEPRREAPAEPLASTLERLKTGLP